MCSSKEDRTIKYSELERKIMAKKLSVETMQECVNQYVNLNVLYVSNNKTEITLL